MEGRKETRNGWEMGEKREKNGEEIVRNAGIDMRRKMKK